MTIFVLNILELMKNKVLNSYYYDRLNTYRKCYGNRLNNGLIFGITSQFLDSIIIYLKSDLIKFWFMKNFIQSFINITKILVNLYMIISKNKKKIENRVINQKFFYSDIKLNLNILNFFEINFFKKSSIFWCSGKIITKIFSTVVILNKYIIKKKEKKINYNLNNKKITKNDLVNIISGGNRPVKKDLSLQHKIIMLTTDHPKFIEIVIDDKTDYSVVIGNLTTNSNNSIKIAPQGILHSNEVYIYNKVTLQKLNNEVLENLEKIIKDNKDIIFTNKVQSSKMYSNNINNFIEKETKQQIFLKNEQIGIEGKIERIKNCIDLEEKMNSRED